MKSFLKKIQKFNDMYKLRSSPTPRLKVNYKEDLRRFKILLSEEVEEVDDITDGTVSSDEALTAMADWFGDVIIYCHTKAASYGLPMDKVLDIIMESNFSKLGVDGEPIYDERGKVEKGPMYWGPEGKIKELLNK